MDQSLSCEILSQSLMSIEELGLGGSYHVCGMDVARGSLETWTGGKLLLKWAASCAQQLYSPAHSACHCIHLLLKGTWRTTRVVAHYRMDSSVLALHAMILDLFSY